MVFFSLRDAKKKLRLALCSADSVAFPMLTHSTRNGLPDHTDPEGKFSLYMQKFCIVCIFSFLLPTKSGSHNNVLLGSTYSSKILA